MSIDPDRDLVEHIPQLVRYARTLTTDEAAAEDLVSETLVRAIERGDGYRGDAAVQTWLHRILHNLAVDRFRGSREYPDNAIEDRVEEQWRDDAYTVDAVTVVARAETAAELRDALIRLPFVYRSAVVLHDAHGLTGQEVAEVQNVSLPAAKQRIRRGRMLLVSALARGAERREALRGVPLNCWEARSRVSDYIDDELPAEQRRLIEAHLHSCPTCPPLYAALVGTRTALQQGADQDRDPDSVIHPEVLATLRDRLTNAEGGALPET